MGEGLHQLHHDDEGRRQLSAEATYQAVTVFSAVYMTFLQSVTFSSTWPQRAVLLALRINYS